MEYIERIGKIVKEIVSLKDDLEKDLKEVEVKLSTLAKNQGDANCKTVNPSAADNSRVSRINMVDEKMEQVNTKVSKLEEKNALMLDNKLDRIEKKLEENSIEITEIKMKLEESKTLNNNLTAEMKAKDARTDMIEKELNERIKTITSRVFKVEQKLVDFDTSDTSQGKVSYYLYLFLRAKGFVKE